MIEYKGKELTENIQYENEQWKQEPEWEREYIRNALRHEQSYKL